MDGWQKIKSGQPSQGKKKLTSYMNVPICVSHSHRFLLKSLSTTIHSFVNSYKNRVKRKIYLMTKYHSIFQISHRVRHIIYRYYTVIYSQV